MFQYSLFYNSSDGELIKIFGELEVSDLVVKIILDMNITEGRLLDSGNFFSIIRSEKTTFICIGSQDQKQEFRRNLAMAKKSLLFEDQILSFLEKEIARKTEIFEHNISEISTQTAQEILYISGVTKIRGVEDIVDISEKLTSINQRDIANSLIVCYKNCLRIERELLVFKALEGQGYSPTLQSHSIHSIFLAELNPFYAAFKDANVNPPTLGECRKLINIDYNTFSAAIHFLYSNGVKYCKPGSDFVIIFKPDDTALKIEIEMNSVFLELDERKKLFNEKFRGIEAIKKTGKDGKGIGMLSARKLLKLSNTSIDFIAGDESTINDNVKYADNKIILTIPVM